MSEENLCFQTFYNGGMATFEIIPMESKFGVAYNGDVIAEVANNEEWEQVSGDYLDYDIFQAVVDKIKNYYD